MQEVKKEEEGNGKHYKTDGRSLTNDGMDYRDCDTLSRLLTRHGCWKIVRYLGQDLIRTGRFHGIDPMIVNGKVLLDFANSQEKLDIAGRPE